MNSSLTTDFLTNVHNRLDSHPLFCQPENNHLREGLSLTEARLAIWFFLGSLLPRLEISQLQFLIRVLDRQIVPRGVKTAFRKKIFWPDKARNKAFIYALAKERKRVAREITARKKEGRLTVPNRKIVTIS